MAVHLAVDPAWAPCGECGCVDGQAGFPRWKLADIYESNVCPRTVVTDDSKRWLEVWRHYEQGHLLAAHGLLQQPAIYIEAMGVITATVAEARSNG